MSFLIVGIMLSVCDVWLAYHGTSVTGGGEQRARERDRESERKKERKEERERKREREREREREKEKDREFTYTAHTILLQSR